MYFRHLSNSSKDKIQSILQTQDNLASYWRGLCTTAATIFNNDRKNDTPVAQFR